MLPDRLGDKFCGCQQCLRKIWSNHVVKLWCAMPSVLGSHLKLHSESWAFSYHLCIDAIRGQAFFTPLLPAEQTAIFKAYHKSTPAIISGCAFFRSSSIHSALIKPHTQQLSSCLFKLSLSGLCGYNFWQSNFLKSLRTCTHHYTIHSFIFLLHLYLCSECWLNIYTHTHTSIMIQDIYSPHSQYRTS